MRSLLGLAAALLAVAASADPHIDYMLECQGCHLSDGAGTSDAVPTLRGEVGKFLAVPGGREFLVRVPGSSQSSLDDRRLAAVLNWMLDRFDPGALPPDFVPFTEEEVSRVRRPPLVDVETVRRKLLGRIEELPPAE